MKTTFRFSAFRTFVLTFVIAISTLSLVAQTTYNVAVTDYQFTPSTLTIKAGDKVIWTLVSTTSNGHNVDGTIVTFPSNPESFGNVLGKVWTYEFVFNTSGTYNYQCDPHAAFGMVGTVTVNPSTATQELAGKVSNLQLFPNPASQFIELLVPANYARINSVKVYSVTGALIDQKVVSGNIESFRYDISWYKNGAYFMEINSGSHKNILKFIKN